MTYFEFTRRFPTENHAIDFIVKTKYNGELVCSKCGAVHHKVYHQRYNRRNIYCSNCKSEFSALSGAIFENTHLDLRMWLYAINLVIISKKGISAMQLQRELTGRVHAVVANLNEEGKKLSGKQLFSVLRKVCKDFTTVVTDQFSGYDILNKENIKNFIRLKVDHSVSFSDFNGIHTNGIESFWAILKRGLYGIYHHVSVKYLQNYVNEFCFRLNNRDNNLAFHK